MKQKLQKFTRATFFFLIIALISCEKDQYENIEQETKAHFERKFLNSEQLPADLQNYIRQNSTNDAARSNSDSDNFSNAVFIPYDIISMTDEKNITNYSVGFLYEDTPENVFYNLVFNVSPTGQSSKTVFKYICNPADFENFKSHNFDFKYFVGITEISTVDDTSNKKLVSKQNSGDDQCPKTYIPSSSDSGGNSGTGGAGSKASGGFNTSVPGYNTPGHTGNSSLGPTTGSSGHKHEGCFGYNGLYWYLDGELKPPHSHTDKMAIDCPIVTPPAGYVPVNTAALMLSYIKTLIVLNKPQLLFLSSKPDSLNLVYAYLYNSEATAQERAFALEIINQMRLNPDFKFDIKASFKSPINIDRSSIPFDLTKPENQKFNEVYNALTKSPEFQNCLLIYLVVLKQDST